EWPCSKCSNTDMHVTRSQLTNTPVSRELPIERAQTDSCDSRDYLLIVVMRLHQLLKVALLCHPEADPTLRFHRRIRKRRRSLRHVETLAHHLGINLVSIAQDHRPRQQI